jgi:hypothetical protein
MTYDRCPCCLGKKKLMGLGAIMKDCHECHGVGYVKPVEEVKPIVKRIRTKVVNALVESTEE